MISVRKIHLRNVWNTGGDCDLYRMKKSKKKAKPKDVVPDPKSEGAVKPEKEKPFDFGGLPDRDLKKNLGCG